MYLNKHKIQRCALIQRPLWIAVVLIVFMPLVASAQPAPAIDPLASPFAVPSVGGNVSLQAPVPSAVTDSLGTSGSIEILFEPLPGASSAPVVTAMCASHDGRYLAVAGDDHVIRLIDVSLQRSVRNLVGHTDWIQSVVFSADSQELFSAGNDGRILQWRHEYPVEAEEIVRLPYAIRSISLSTQRQLLAIGGFSSAVKVWDLTAKDWKYQFTCECQDHNCVRFSPSGDKLLGGGRDGVLEVWDMYDGRVVLHQQLHQKRIATASFSTDGNKVTSAGEDRHLIQYDLLTGETVLDREIVLTKLKSLCLINDNLVAVAGADNSIRLYDMASDAVIAKLEGHFGSVAVMCACDGLLVSGSFDTTIRLWNLVDEVNRQTGSSQAISLAPLDVDARMRIR